MLLLYVVLSDQVAVLSLVLVAEEVEDSVREAAALGDVLVMTLQSASRGALCIVSAPNGWALGMPHLSHRSRQPGGIFRGATRVLLVGSPVIVYGGVAVAVLVARSPHAE